MQEKRNDDSPLRVGLITQGLSPLVAPIDAEPCAKLACVIESLPEPHRAESFLKQVGTRLRDRIRHRNSLERYAKHRNIPYIPMTKGNLPELDVWLEQQRCDVVVVFSMAHLLPVSVLAIPHLGVLNLHRSMLPAYRGPNPIFWTYYYAKPVGGVTLHYIDPGEDTGDIIYQKPFPISPGMRLPQLEQIAIKQHGVELVLQALRVLAHGGMLPRQVQPKNSPTPRARHIRSDEHRFLIDWPSWNVERIWHLLRGTESWFGAIDAPGGLAVGQRWTVLGTENTIVTGCAFGSIGKDGRGHYVVCKDGLIRLGLHFKVENFLKFLYRKL